MSKPDIEPGQMWRLKTNSGYTDYIVLEMDTPDRWKLFHLGKGVFAWEIDRYMKSFTAWEFIG